MLDVLSEDYIRTARAKGVATGPMLMKHALKNAGVPIVTVIGIGVALLIGGVVITETVFNIPGVGRLVVDAISQRDYPIIQGVTLIFSGVYVIVNLIVDLSYTVLDPEDPLLRWSISPPLRPRSRRAEPGGARAHGVSCDAIRPWSSASSFSASCCWRRWPLPGSPAIPIR